MITAHFGGKWYLQDSQLLLEANLKQGKDFQAFASLHLAFVVNDVALKYNPAIRPEEHLQRHQELLERWLSLRRYFLGVISTF